MTPDILLENEELVAVHKPSGLLSIPDREGKEVSLKLLLQERLGQILTIHRLDKDTSGIIVFARTEAMHRYLSVAFETRTVQKDYLGLVMGIPPEKEKIIDAPIMEHPVKKGTMVIHAKGKPSVTEYRVLESLGRYSWLGFRIHTGRTHQIRVHLQHEGHPIACDPIYGDGQPILLSQLKRHYKLSRNELSERPLLNRLALHASRLVIPMPEGSPLELEARLPKDLQACLNQLRKIAGTKT